MKMKVKNLYYQFVKSAANSGGGHDKFVIDMLQSLPQGLKLLDAGAGESRFKKYGEHLEYITQDFCEYTGTGDGKALQTGEWNTKQIDIVSDIVHIPVEDSSFDVILCSEVFEHIPEPEKAVEEFSRILRPGGTLILTAPFNSLVHFSPYHYCTGFSKYWYEYHLDKYGFKIESLKENGNWFRYLQQEILRARNMQDRYCHKRNYLNWLLCAFTARMLGKSAEKDIGSAEVGCIGYFVVAKLK